MASRNPLPNRMFQGSNGECPYLSGREWLIRFFFTAELDGEIYERLLASGWRRNGISFYCNVCGDCGECVPLRVNIPQFRPSRSQLRNLRKNRDLRYELEPAGFHRRDFELYCRYLRHRHPREELPSADNYRMSLVDSPVDSRIMRIFSGDQLAGVAWLDFTPNSLSSVYLAFEPEFSGRAPGVYTVLSQVEIGRQLGKQWLYLGFYVKDCRKMNYKIRYRPCQLRINGHWQPVA